MPTSPGRKRGCIAARFLLAVLAIHNFHYAMGNDIIVNKDQPKRSKQDWDPSRSLRPLHRTKRRWVITTLELEEEGRGPFPELIGELFNNASQNTSIKYSISGPGVDEFPEYGLFSIEDDAHGHVYVHSSIDRERTPSFSIRFDVHNRMTGAILDSSLFFNIEIKDINDNAPEFLQKEFNINIKENHHKKEPVFKVIAVDKDQEGTANSQVVFCLVSQKPDLKPPLFTIDSTSGLIHITQCLDYEANRNFRLVIRASDRGSPSLSSTATVNIVVEDSNNNLPVFTPQKYHADVSEGRNKNDILRLKVEDKDSPNTAAWRAKYIIKRGNERGNFAIETDPKTNEGVLSVIKPMVYSTPSERKLLIAVKNEESFFICQRGFVSFNASPQLSEASVSINITDENDAPEFNPPILNLPQQEGVMPGTRLVQYAAQDPDTGQHKIKYKVVSDPGGWVTIDENSGIVTAAKTLNRESPFVNNSMYTIVIHAIDDGVPPLTGTGTIQLHLSDLNDNAPTLVTTSLITCEGKGLGPFHIKAEDKDSYPYAEPFTFQLEEALGGTENLWRLGENLDNSVELFMLKSLPPGDYFVPLLIRDLQGFSRQQILDIHVCSCPDGITCEQRQSLKTASLGLSGGAIGIIVAAFLLLLLCLALLALCSCVSKVKKEPAFIPYEAGNQSLIHYNEESERVLDAPDSGTQATPSSVHAKNVKKKQQVLENDSAVMQVKPTGNHQYPNGSVTSPFNTIKAWNQLEPVNHWNIKAYPKNPQEKISEIVAVALKQKCDDMANLEDNVASYVPRVYAEEGVLEKNESLWSLSILEDDKNSLPEDFLGVLEPSFIPLAKICSK
ncbi:cadherin-like protein 26 [Protobothrops mucrosquamatus]|uniref:cadherin-like protein 26 n=1 Tax=Protobothrops mucrosquamatus TaxID=103944 RepID=UPI000775B7D2|nr:cadherin-like protein 26 [Protobothrops mucrosquamatus]